MGNRYSYCAHEVRNPQTGKLETKWLIIDSNPKHEAKRNMMIYATEAQAIEACGIINRPKVPLPRVSSKAFEDGDPTELIEIGHPSIFDDFVSDWTNAKDRLASTTAKINEAFSEFTALKRNHSSF